MEEVDGAGTKSLKSLLQPLSSKLILEENGLKRVEVVDDDREDPIAGQIETKQHNYVSDLSRRQSNSPSTI